jgi:hypothetical protein
MYCGSRLQAYHIHSKTVGRCTSNHANDLPKGFQTVGEMGRLTRARYMEKLIASGFQISSVEIRMD